MEERKWENLEEDCLVNIFGRLDVESLLLDVPLVCKQCQGCATTIVLPDCISREDLVFVSDKCPSLKVLAVSGDPYVIDTYEDDVGCAVSDLLVNWKSLEVLKLDRCSDLAEIIGKIGLHCKNFVELSVRNTEIDQVVATAIVSNLSTITRLVLDQADLEKVNLELILKGCKELELLYVRDCEGFDEDDEEILMLASGIKDFQCQGSKIYEPSSDDGYEGPEYYEDYAYGNF